MNLCILFLILLTLPSTTPQPQPSNPPTLTVGNIAPGQIDPSISNQKQHPITLGDLQMKYLFIRLTTYDTNVAAIGLYAKNNDQSGELIFSCLNKTYDTCYIPRQLLIPNTEYIILIMSNIPLTYNLYTYWGDLQHLIPGEDIKFMFDGKDKTQLFHLQLADLPDFKQIRIMLKPQTMRTQGDSLKIFVNIGQKQNINQFQIDFQSVHVWNDAQAIFLSKQDIKDQKGITIYIVGNAKTVYILSCELVQGDLHTLDLNQNLYEYIRPNQNAIYHMKLQSSSNVDSYVVRFSVFTGEVQVGFYYDKQMTNQFKKLPFQYMSDIQFHIQKQDLTPDTKDLYMLVTSQDKNCTYQLNIQGRKKSVGFEMFQNVFEFVPIRSSQSMYFYSHIWNENQFDTQKMHTFDINIIQALGSFTPKFYLCKPNANIDICKQTSNPDFSQNTIQLLPTSNQPIGKKNIYSIQISQNDYSDINSVQKRALIILQLITINKSLSYAAVQFSNPSKVRLLREGRAFQDKVRLSEIKYYKYQNDNPNIKLIKIHINQISGLINTTARRTDPRLQQTSKILMDPDSPNTIVITDDITKPIYIQVLGIVTSIYTVSVSTLDEAHPYTNSLIMAEDVQYQIKLMPLEQVTVQIHPIQSEVIFEFKCDGGTISLCQIDEQQHCKIDKKAFGEKGQLKIDARTASEVRIKIGNFGNINQLIDPPISQPQFQKPSSSTIRRLKATLSYHAQGSTQCNQKKINKIYSQVIKSGSCFKFSLPLSQDLQMIWNQQHLTESYQTYFLCSHQIIPEFHNNRYIIKKSVLQSNCKLLPNDMNLQVLVGDTSSHGDKPNNIRLDYSVQYLNDIITLADGVAYYTKTKSSQSAIKKFFYEIIDETNNIQIVLFNKKGIQNFYAKITSSQDKYDNYPTESQTTINSKNSNYYTNPSIQITKQNIEKAKCGRNCQLIISIFSKQFPGTEIQFGIQVTQNQILLKQNQIQNGFLFKGSVKYYQYTSRTPTDLFFKISDTNRHCAKSYLSTHPFPSSSNNIMTQNLGSLLYKQTTINTYYFAVQALDDCPYSISVSQGDSQLTKIQHGQQYDIKMKAEETKWFYLHHISNSSFKIISLLKYGLISISVTKIQLGKQLLTNLSTNTINKQSFPFKNSYLNCLTIDNKQKQFCFNCYYLVNIYSTVLTQGSIFLASPSTKISLSTGKILYDQLKNIGQATLAIFYKISKGTIDIDVTSGKIKVEMSYQDQKFEKAYEQSKKKYTQDYSFTHLPQIFTPLQIKIIALQTPVFYSLQLRPQKSPTTNIIKLIPGQISQIQFVHNSNTCFQGTLRAKSQYIYIIIDSGNHIDLSSIKISAKLNNTISSIQQQQIGNIISIRFIHSQIFFPQPQQYSICLSSNTTKSFSFNALQNQNINLLPSDTQLLIRNSSTFAIHHTGYLILDIFQCAGKAQIVYSQTTKQLQTKKSNPLDIIGFSGLNHVVRTQSQEVLFLKVKADMATLLWMPLIEQKQRGIGYYKYSIGTLSYVIGFNTIRFLIGGVYKIRPTNTTIHELTYTLYISNSRYLLQQGLMCQKKSQQKLFKIQLNSTNINQQYKSIQISIDVDKKKINNQFQQNQTLYFNVIANLLLLPPNQQNSKYHQHYKFIYFEQLVLSSLFRQNQIQKRIDLNFYYNILAIILTLLCCFLLATFVFIKWIAPTISKIKNWAFVEQTNQIHRQHQVQPPPSSDRNNISSPTDQRIK